MGDLHMCPGAGLHGCLPKGSPWPHLCLHSVPCGDLMADPELLPLAQSEVISHFQSLRRSEVHLVERVLQSYSCASLSAMRQPGSIPFPFNPGARLTLPRSTPKSAVSIPGLRFPAAFPTKPSNAAKRHKIRSWQRSPRPVALRPKQPGTPH